MIKLSFRVNLAFLTIQNYLRQDLQDYFDFCAFLEERHKPNRPDGENLIFRGKRIVVAQGLQEPE